MNKLGRLAAWGKEKMGSDSKNSLSEDYKALELEMQMRHEGIEKMYGSMATYVKSLTKRTEGDGKEKSIPIGYLGITMSRHGEAFEEGSKFGEALLAMGQVNERIARMQETYGQQATSSWLESLERSMAQMKDYQAAKKKLDNRRAAYDSTLSKIQKAKKEDYRAEEDLRSQKAKYEESTDDVYRRMQDIVDSEKDSLDGIYGFLEAELNYHDRAREALIQLKRNFPAPGRQDGRPSPPNRSRSSTLQSQISQRARTATIDEDELPPPPLPFRGSQPTSGASSPAREVPGFDWGGARPGFSRNATSDTVSAPRPVISRGVTADSSSMLRQPTPLRSIRQRSGSDVFSDPTDDDLSSSPGKYWDNDRSSSPATSASGGLPYSSQLSRNTSWENNPRGLSSSGSGTSLATQVNKKGPPPPPPSRGSKPPPPPPPKRSALGNSVSAYSG